MILIDDGNRILVNLWYPLINWRRPLRVFEWNRFGRWIYLRAVATILVLAYGIALLDHDFFTDSRYNLFALLVLALSCLRLRLMLPMGKMNVVDLKRYQRAPLAAVIDYSGGNLVLGIMCIAFATQPEPGPFGFMFILGLLFVLYASLSILPSVVLLFQKS